MANEFTSDELMLLEAAVGSSISRYRDKIASGEWLGLELRRWEALQKKVRELSDAAY